MHAFKCPKCGRLLATPSPLKKATVKCRACGTAFIGNTVPMDTMAPEKQVAGVKAAPTAAGAAKQPALSARPALRAGPSNTRLLLIITLTVMVVGLIAMIVVFSQYYGTIEVTYLDDSGREVTRRMPKEEAAAIKENIAKKAQAAMTGGKGPDAKGGGVNSPADASEKNDPSISQLSWFVAPLMGAEDMGYITGQVKSAHADCLRTLELSVQLINQQGKEIKTIAASTIEYVPATSTVRYSAYFEGVPIDNIKDVKITARSTAEPGLVCWDAEDAKATLERAVVSVKGAAVVHGKQDVRDAEIYCEFYTPDGVTMGAVRGEIEGSHAHLRGGATVKFTASKPVDETQPPMGVQAHARLIAKLE